MDVTVKVEGLKEIEDALAKAGPNLARSAVRKALDAGADVFLKEAKLRAPLLKKPTANRQPGELRDAIAEVTTTNAKNQTGRGRVGLKYDGKRGSQSPGVYGLFVEFGTHKMKAQPYMRPAYDSAQKRAESVFTAEMRAGVEKLGKRT